MCELNHYPAILALREQGISTRVVAICDPQDPRQTQSNHYSSGRANLKAVLAADKPVWINPNQYTASELKAHLTEFCNKSNVQIVVIAADPVNHYFYADWAAERGISTLCDKPLIVVPDASWKMDKAALIDERFRSLSKKVQQARTSNPNYVFCMLLRRRALTPFLDIANNLRSVYERTDEGITYVHAVLNSGIHHYPAEFLKGGAHGYLDGVGSLSHSSYHFLDILAWYLQVSPGKIKRIGISLPHVSRVRDYLSRKGYKQLLILNNEQPAIVEEGIDLPERVLNAELDFTIHISLYNKSNTKIGLMSYTSNHTSYTPRTTKYDPLMLDHANDKNGGRMSHVYFDIHQGSVQNWSLIKNDAVFSGNKIETIQRLHPSLGNSYKHVTYDDAYDRGTTTLKDLFILFVKLSAGHAVDNEGLEYAQTLDNQWLTHKIFSTAYELIARNFEDPKNKDKILIDLIQNSIPGVSHAK